MTVVDCPLCGEAFDASEAAVRRSHACPHCGASWQDCHRAVAPQPDPTEATVQYPIDEPAGVETE